MGLGKTVQTIALLLAIKQDEKKVRALIVAPTSVVTTGERELARFSPPSPSPSGTAPIAKTRSTS
jgi:SNF2 family DNA or RNA helicase